MKFYESALRICHPVRCLIKKPKGEWVLPANFGYISSMIATATSVVKKTNRFSGHRDNLLTQVIDSQNHHAQDFTTWAFLYSWLLPLLLLLFCERTTNRENRWLNPIIWYSIRNCFFAVRTLCELKLGKTTNHILRNYEFYFGTIMSVVW